MRNDEVSRSNRLVGIIFARSDADVDQHRGAGTMLFWRNSDPEDVDVKITQSPDHSNLLGSVDLCCSGSHNACRCNGNPIPLRPLPSPCPADGRAEILSHHVALVPKMYNIVFTGVNRK